MKNQRNNNNNDDTIRNMEDNPFIFFFFNFLLIFFSQISIIVYKTREKGFAVFVKVFQVIFLIRKSYNSKGLCWSNNK